jgi:hypothetical protein
LSAMREGNSCFLVMKGGGRDQKPALVRTMEGEIRLDGLSIVEQAFCLCL